MPFVISGYPNTGMSLPYVGAIRNDYYTVILMYLFSVRHIELYLIRVISRRGRVAPVFL